MKQQQTGGTLIGFVAGVLVGLGVALGVAVYVAKVPVPFVERSVTRAPGEDAKEAERNKNWNPNASVSGKPAASSQAPAPTATAPSKPASADPLGDLAQARTGAANAPGTGPAAAGGAEGILYFVQAGAFRNPADAESQRAKLAMAGHDAKVSESQQAGAPIYRVRLGPYEKKTEAEAQQEKLSGAGYDTALVRAPRAP